MTDHTVQMGSEEGNKDRQSAQVGHRLTVVLEIPVGRSTTPKSSAALRAIGTPTNARR